MKIKEILKDNLTLYHSYLLIRKEWYKLFYTDSAFHFKQYKKAYGKNPDLTNPKTFHEKLIWSMLNHRNELYIKCADKFEVRDFVKTKVGEEYLIKNYGIYNRYEDIKFEELPGSFVLKATHASGWNLLCCNKENLNIHKASKALKFWLSHNYYEFDREWPYNFMPKRVICDEYVCTKKGIPPMDYKIYCFNGEPKYIQLDIDRCTCHKRNIYDIEWNLMKDIVIVYPQDFSKVYEKPLNFEKMLEVARKLSGSFEHVRIDLYNLDGKIYFGEMTFFSGGGISDYYNSSDFHLLVGSWFNLPEANIHSFNRERILENLNNQIVISTTTHANYFKS